MAIRDVFKVSRKTFFNPTNWLDYNSVKRHTLLISDVIKGLFSRDQPTNRESFEDAMVRLGLTDADVQNTAERYRGIGMLFFLVGLLIVVYAGYLLFYHGVVIATLISLAVAALSFLYAFRYDFWALQMRRRQLGLTFNEWKQSILGGKGASK